jgi:hypothetical protein
LEAGESDGKPPESAQLSAGFSDAAGARLWSTARLSRFLVGCYPRRWRERYREEMLDVLDQHRPADAGCLLAGVVR